MATSKNVLNLDLAGRGQDVNFVELVPVAELGPLGQAMSTTAQTNVNAVLWSIVPNMTQDLKNAIISFIDKDKTGRSMANNSFEGRTKTIEFEFQGMPSNIYQFGEIGVLQIVLSYPPGSATISTPIAPHITGAQITTG